MKFEIGDWVQAKTRNGEFVHGFIDTLDRSRSMAKVVIVRSDNEPSVGRTADVPESWLRELPASPKDDPEAIRDLIDVALAARDEAWFRELTDRLKNASGESETAKAAPRVRSMPVNRLGYTA